jgi:hypothetical protein
MNRIKLDKSGEYVCITHSDHRGMYDINVDLLKKEPEHWKDHLLQKNWFSEYDWKLIEKVVYG